MENRNKPVSKTETKYQVTSCCFCNEIVDNDAFKVNQIYANDLDSFVFILVFFLEFVIYGSVLFFINF